jgi:hypothetical protein
MSGTVQPAAPFDDVVSDDADTMIHFEHPARAEEFAAVAVLATLAYEADETGSALPPLWPMVLHSSFTDLILPVPGADADASSSDAASIPELIRALRSLIPRHQHGGALGIRRMLYLRGIKHSSTTSSHRGLCRCSHGCLGVELRLMQRSSKPRGHLRSSRLRTSTHVQCVANTPGAIKGIVSLVGSTDHHDACEHAVRALGNIAGKSSLPRPSPRKRCGCSDVERRLSDRHSDVAATQRRMDDLTVMLSPSHLWPPLQPRSRS